MDARHAARTLGELNVEQTKKCQVNDCEHDALYWGFCKGHYERFRRHGSPQAHIPLGKPRGRAGTKDLSFRTRLPKETYAGLVESAAEKGLTVDSLVSHLLKKGAEAHVSFRARKAATKG